MWLPAIFDGLGEGFEKVAGHVEDFELGEASDGVRQRLQLVRVHVEHHHVQQPRRQRFGNALLIKKKKEDHLFDHNVRPGPN